ncbi:MAG TPA: hypothetical protein VFW65_35400 [Pseudonocardiaceae bacterium]|nr:hypothetical protein [Pseudonocardiaceae bacterium]
MRTVIVACYVPHRLWASPVLEQFASAFSYAPVLRRSPTLVPFPVPAAAMLAALCLALWVASVDMRLRIHAFDR